MNEKIYLEHANMTVTDLDKEVDFFKTAFPFFEIRGGGSDLVEGGEKRWLHLGTQQTYLALSELPNGAKLSIDHTSPIGFNHIGFVVDDVNAIADRLSAKGYKRTYPRQEEKTRIREYFGDVDGNEVEFVQYLSTDWAERNVYDE